MSFIAGYDNKVVAGHGRGVDEDVVSHLNLRNSKKFLSTKQCLDVL